MQRFIPFQSPRGDFGFLKGIKVDRVWVGGRGYGFNPLAGILVF